MVLKLAIATFIGIPILAGLMGAVLPALGYFPLLGRASFSFDAFMSLAAEPGLLRSIKLTLVTGVVATFLSTVLALMLPGLLFATPRFGWLRQYLAPVLSLPHVTVAVGMLFLLQPSGWLMRLMSPWLTGYDRPPIYALVPDDHGFALVLGLAAKEVPFLVLMVVAALGQIDTAKLMLVARSLGYGKMRGWLTVIIPQLWPRMRLPVMIVIVFSLSVIDMAIVLAPSTPAPLSVRTLTWYQDPDLGMRFTASASAVLQLLICLAGIAVMMILELLIRFIGRRIVHRGNRHPRVRRHLKIVLPVTVSIAGLLPLLIAVMGMAAALIWSVAAAWRFPDALPSAFSFRYWMALTGDLGLITFNSLILGAISSGLAVLLAIIWLEHRHPPGRGYEQLIFLPLLVPQIGFLFGLQVMLLWIGVDGLIMTIIWAHMLFVFPYVRAYLITGKGYLEGGYMDGRGGGNIEEWVSEDKGNTWRMNRDLTPDRKRYPAWRFNHIQPVVRSNGEIVDGMLLFYGWKDGDSPTAKAFLLHE